MGASPRGPLKGGTGSECSQRKTPTAAISLIRPPCPYGLFLCSRFPSLSLRSFARAETAHKKITTLEKKKRTLQRERQLPGDIRLVAFVATLQNGNTAGYLPTFRPSLLVFFFFLPCPGLVRSGAVLFAMHRPRTDSGQLRCVFCPAVFRPLRAGAVRNGTAAVETVPAVFYS